jgi:hypothetical protein
MNLDKLSEGMVIKLKGGLYLKVQHVTKINRYNYSVIASNTLGEKIGLLYTKSGKVSSAHDIEKMLTSVQASKEQGMTYDMYELQDIFTRFFYDLEDGETINLDFEEVDVHRLTSPNVSYCLELSLNGRLVEGGYEISEDIDKCFGIKAEQVTDAHVYYSEDAFGKLVAALRLRGY